MSKLAFLAVAGLVLVPAARPALQPFQGEVVRIAAYVGAYERAFSSLLADEVCLQEVIRRGRAVARRETRGEFFAVFLDRDLVWMTVHDVLSLDGAPVGERTGLAPLLARRSVESVGRDLAEANARYNIGSVSRNFNEPTLPLQLLASRRARDVRFSSPRRLRGPDGVALVSIEFRLRDDASFVRSRTGRRVRVAGSVVAEHASGRIHRTMLTIADGQVDATLETTYVAEDRLGLWVPSVFAETYRAGRLEEITTVRSAFVNYRRFETSGRVVD
jgi:hypothetical protein